MLSPPSAHPVPDGGYASNVPQIHGFGPGGAVTGYGGRHPSNLLGAHHGFVASVLAHLLGAHAPVHFPPALNGVNPGGIVEGLPPDFGGSSGPFPYPTVGHLGGNPAENFVPSAPTLPAGTYTGAYAAQGLRTTDPHAAAQLWESRHPAAVHSGHIPGWVTHALLSAIAAHMPAPPAAAPAPPVPSYQAQ